MNRRVGVAPSTTTFRLDGFGSPWAPGYPDPSQKYMPPGATIVGGANVPHDFELAKIFGYTPVHQGWIVGNVTPGGGLNGFGATDEETAYQTKNDLEHQMMMQRMAEEMKTLRWNRIWSGVSALAAVGAVAISIAAFRRRRR